MHDMKDMKFVAIKKVISESQGSINSKLLGREGYWTSQLFTLNSYGIDKGNGRNANMLFTCIKL